MNFSSGYKFFESVEQLSMKRIFLSELANCLKNLKSFFSHPDFYLFYDPEVISKAAKCITFTHQEQFKLF